MKKEEDQKSAFIRASVRNKVFTNNRRSRAGQVRKLVCKSANPKLRTSEKSCGLWRFKLRTCGCELFLILVRNSASFIQILKFLSIFVNNLCFYPVKLKKSINFFEFKFGKNNKFLEFRLTKILSLLFDLIAFFLLTRSCFEFGATTEFFRV